MIETRSCPRCSSWFANEQVDGEFSGICPRCLAASLISDPGGGSSPSLAISGPGGPLPELDAAPAGTALLPGTRFGGFEILSVLGEGGMGVVYKARQTSLDRIVALKVLAPHFAGSEEFARRFDREAKVLATLNHPHVVQVHDFGREGGVPYLVMEHVDGESLETALKRGRPEPAWMLRVLREVSRGLRRVHEAGLVHRDLKPANILITRDGTAKIGDFGLAVETRTNQRLTEPGYFVGTPYYVSPEHAKGEKVDGRSDLYALGVILFEGFAGRPPFVADSPSAVLVKHMEEPAPPLERYAPEAPATVAAVVRRLLEKDPARRFGSASELEAVLSAASIRRGTPARRPKPLALGAAAIVLLAVLTIVFWPSSLSAKPVLPLLIAADSALKSDLFDEAARAAAEAKRHSGDDLTWAAQARALYDRIIEIRIDRAAVRNGDDEEFGQFLCFSKGDWEQGLPMIAAGEESPYRAIAKQDLARPSDAAGCIAIADGWLDAAKRAKKPRWAARMKERAWAWLSAARAGASAAQRGMIDPRLAELDATLEARRAIDLLQLANPAKFAVAGEFTLEGGRLRTPPTTPFARLSLPYLPPDEYDLELAVERRTGEGVFYVGLPHPSGATGVEFGAAGPLLPEGKTVRILLSVRRERLEVSADGATILDTRSIGSVGETWRVPEKRLIILGSNASAFWITKASLRGALSLPAAPGIAPKPPLPARAPEPADVDLLKAIDVQRDIVSGDWSMPGGALVSSAKDYFSRVRVPATLPEEYDLEVDVERLTGDQDFFLGLVQGSSELGVMLDAGHSTYCVIQAKVDHLDRVERSVLPGGRAHTILCRVRKWNVEILVDGQRVLGYRGDLSKGSMFPQWTVPKRPALIVGSHASSHRVTRLRLLPARDGIDLLAPLDLRRDVVAGTWSKTDRGVASTQGDKFGRLQLPAQLPESYDLRIRAERKEGSGALNIGLLVGNRPCCVVLDGWTGDISGLELIENGGADKNETTSRGRPILRRGKPVSLLCSVRPSSIRVAVDGALLFDWKGDPGRLSLHPDFILPNTRGLFLGSSTSSFEISRVSLLPVPEVDLLVLVDPARDTVAGEWKRSGSGLLTTTTTPFPRILVPYEMPQEYDLMVEAERKEGIRSLILGLVSGSSPFTVLLDGWTGTTSGLDLLDGKGADKNESTVQGTAFLPLNQRVTIAVSVRKTAVLVRVDGRVVIDWKGDSSRLSLHKNMDLPRKGFFIATWDSRFLIHRATIIPVACEAAGSTRGPGMDLLALVDLARDSAGGEWTREGQAVVSDRTKFARLEIPYEPPQEYTLRVVFERVAGFSDVNQILVAGGRQFVWVLGAGNSRYGFGMVNGEWIGSPKNPTLGDAVGYQVGELHESIIDVRRDGVTCSVDGRRLLNFKTDFSNFSMADGWRLGRRNALGLGSYESPTRFHRVELVEVRGEGRPLGADKPTLDGAHGPKEGFIDLLGRVDPKAGTVSGKWTREGTDVVSDDAERAKLELPYEPPAEYDFRIVFSRVRGISDVNQILSVGGRPFAWCMGGMANSISGFGSIQDIWAPEKGNPSRVQLGIEPGRVYDSIVQVRRNGVKAFLNGILVCQWRTDYRDMDLQVPWRLRDDRVLGLGTFNSPTRFHRAEVREVTGTGRPKW